MGTLKAKEIAQKYRKSVAWVYANAHHLGGSQPGGKGGAWIFEEEEVQRALQRARQEGASQMARQRHGSRTAEDKAVRHQGRGKKVGARGKEEVEIWGTDPSRHGIANFLFQISGLCGAEVFNENLQGEEGAGSEGV